MSKPFFIASFTASLATSIILGLGVVCPPIDPTSALIAEIVIFMI